MSPRGLTRRQFVSAAATGAAVAGAWLGGARWLRRQRFTEVFVAKAASYAADLPALIHAGMHELGVTPSEISGKVVLLKPNLVEPRRGAEHVNTHPAVILGAAQAFLALGAAEVIVGEGSGHCRDALLVLEESGLGEALREERLAFVDLNADDWDDVPNAGGAARIRVFALPLALRRADWVVSLAKMKTHHWAGVTLSMKNLFGVLPGAVYGWPKTMLHLAGIHHCAADLLATVRPRFAIVDGIVGMEGDGPIMGTAKSASVLVMGRDLASVDATAARIMGVDPARIGHLVLAPGGREALAERAIHQRGETIAAVASPFALIERIPAHKGLRL